MNECKRDLHREERKKNTGQKNKDETAGQKMKVPPESQNRKLGTDFQSLSAHQTSLQSKHLILLISFSSLVYNLPRRNSINKLLFLKVL